MKKIYLKHFCLLLVFSIAGTAYSQDCDSYLQQAAKLVSQKKYCDAKSYYQKYSDCNADADVSAEIAMCEKFCKAQAMEAGDNETIDKTGDSNPLGAKAVAPDVIILKSGDEVKSIVQEVGTEYVKYKKFDNQTGPVYNMALSEIFMIRYANGSKDVFAEKTDEKQALTNSQQATNENNQMTISSEKKLLFDNNPSSFYFHIRDHSGRKLSSGEVRAILMDNSEIMDIYDTGHSKRIWGFTFMGAALASETVALTSFIVALTRIGDDQGYTMGYKECMKQGYIFLAAGVVFIIPEYILLFSGKKDVNKAINMYNDAIDNKKSSNLSLKFGLTPSGGVGFTLNF